jgi:hypothetical protein
MMRNLPGEWQTGLRGAAASPAASEGSGLAVQRTAGKDLRDEPAHRRNP